MIKSSNAEISAPGDFYKKIVRLKIINLDTLSRTAGLFENRILK